MHVPAFRRLRRGTRDTGNAGLPRRRVVIVGGGFAGLFAARVFHGLPVDVTVIDRAAHHLFQPLLYQVATGVLSEGQIAVPLRGVLKRHRNVDCLLAEVTGVDVEARSVRAERPGGDQIEVPYDDLIVAAGVRQSYFGHDEFAKHAPGMKTLADALDIRRRVFGAFEMAQTATDAGERERWLTFALVGAGPTGVELAGQIRDLATLTLHDQFKRIVPTEARVLLFDGGSEPLAPFGQALAAKVAESLSDLGVELLMHSVVEDVDEKGLLVRRRDGATCDMRQGQCCGQQASRRHRLPTSWPELVRWIRTRRGGSRWLGTSRCQATRKSPSLAT